MVETTAWGAAVLAGVHAGVFKDINAAGAQWSAENAYEPDIPNEAREGLYNGWKSAINKVLI